MSLAAMVARVRLGGEQELAGPGRKVEFLAQDEAKFAAAAITSIRSHNGVSNFDFNPPFLSPERGR
jgi:hypothetical protein